MKYVYKLYLLSLLAAGALVSHSVFGQQTQLRNDALNAMKRATQYMVENVSKNGGYVWLYLSDLSRRWGELEAYESQIWIQGVGTVAMGNVFLNAFQATGDAYYYKAAEKAADALIWGQLPCGGWNYIVDFSGDRSLKKWYHTIGQNAWGFEEFYHYYGNATFDDVTTAEAAKFLLRMYMEKRDPKFKTALDKAISLVVKSQYPLGGWPQRYPLKYDFPHGYDTDYTSFYTFNDDVISDNIDFLIACYDYLGRADLLDAIHRGMDFYLVSQQGNPQGGWGQQYDMDLKPAHARSFEPPALLPSYTYDNAMELIKFYQYTGDRRFLSRIPDAISWLESTRLPAAETEGGRYTHPTFIEVRTNKALYAHRSGTGVLDGRYWWDYKDENPLLHYGAKAKVDIDHLKALYRKVSAQSPEEATKGSPLKEGSTHLKSLADYSLNPRPFHGNPDPSAVTQIISTLDDKGRWLSQHEWSSRPYSVSADGKPINTARFSTEGGAAIKDSTDQQYISTKVFIHNMQILTTVVREGK